MRSRITIYCPLCLTNSVYSKLKLHQISLTAAVYLCEDKNCAYPKGFDWMEVKRSLDELLYEKQHSTGDSDLDNWLEEAFEREMSNVNVTCKNVTSEYNTDNFLAEIFKELESSMSNIEPEHVNVTAITNQTEPEHVVNVSAITNQTIVKSKGNMNESSCNYLESVFGFENENFVLNYKNS